MLAHPSVRKGATDPASVPFINYPDSGVYIQDDQFLPEYSQDLPLQYLSEQGLQSPFQYHQNLNLVSPPSPVPSSPLSSPASSVSHFPSAKAASADYTVFDGPSSFEAPSMTPASSYNPEIHIQHAGSPQPQSYLPQYTQPQFVFDNSPMLAQQQYFNNHGWENKLNAQRMPHQTPLSGRSSGHSLNNTNNRSAAYNSAPTKPLPTPVHTPVQQSFLTPQFQKNELSHDGSYSFEQQQQQQQNQQSSEHSHSHAPSVSTVSHNSPVTPQNQFEDVEDSKVASNDYSGSNGYPNGLPMSVPKLNRTITDAFQDELFNPTVMQTPQMSKQHNQQNQNLLAPSYQNILGNRIQAANSARAQSPNSINRERSPFRQNSPFSVEYDHDAFRQQPVTSAPTSQPGMAMQHHQPQAEPNTISPKDAVLNDFNEGDDHGIHIPYQSDFNIGDALGFRQENNFHQAPNFPSMDSFHQYSQPQAAQQQFFSSQPQPQQHQQQQARRPSAQQNNFLHHTPEFPASLPRFESTGSEVYGHDLTSPTMTKTSVPIQRPQNTSSDGGTYTCTYHGCTQRFESPQKLQKHKRDAHRPTTPGGHMAGRDVQSRNSQAGPHRCMRENPTTGKPCNSVFSRPYDLTRHEDTIHNARKQKVRCHLCTEEKTFSRNDALTRHMRVVHPEVDWPGKQRRRGRE